MNDLIYRQDAIGACAYGTIECYEARKMIRNLPSAGQDCVLCEHYTEIETDDGIKGKCTRRTGSDLISRADVLEGLKHSTAYLHDDIYTIVNRIPSAETTGALDDAIAKYVADGLMELPSADRPTGEWINKDGGLANCSICDERWGAWDVMNYCPNCGAKMKGGTE